MTTHASTTAVLARPALISFEVLDAADPLDRESWEESWKRSGRGDVFSHFSYLSHMALPGEKPACAVASFDDGSTVLYAFVIRPITHDAAGSSVGSEYFDIYTALVYGGPIATGVDDDQMAMFWKRFSLWATEHKVVSEIIRFWPVPDRRHFYPGTTRLQAPHVVRHLDGVEPEGIVAGMRTNARRSYRQALKAGMTIQVDSAGERYHEFREIYRETMGRVGANRRFLFQDELFEEIHHRFAGRFAYIYAMDGGRAVSVDLMLYADGVSCYFLGGTRTEALRSGAHVLVSDAAMRSSLEHGCIEHVLTGGVTNTMEDSLLEFKRRIAPEGLSEYCTGEQIFLPEIYAQLSGEASEEARGSGFFPLYRAENSAEVRGHDDA